MIGREYPTQLVIYLANLKHFLALCEYLGRFQSYSPLQWVKMQDFIAELKVHVLPFSLLRCLNVLARLGFELTIALNHSLLAI